MPALMTPPRRPKKTGPFLRHSHTINPATSAKLIHLKRFSADCCDAEPASSARALSARKNTENSSEATILVYRLAVSASFGIIGILLVQRQGAELIAIHAGLPAPQI